MPKGKPTSAEKLAEFRAHYLLSGNASESARTVGISESAGRELAVKLAQEPAFGEERRALRAQYLDECVAARMAIVRKAKDRATREDADQYPGPGGGVTVVDKRPDWANVVLNAEKNAHSLAKIESASQATDAPTEVHIMVSGPGSGASDTE